MPRPALTEEQRRETRRRIRQAASELYTEAGIGQISARAVASRANVSVGTLYTHFGNLTELMQSLWKEPASRLIARMREIAAGTEDPAARLESLLKEYAKFAEEQRGIYRGAFLYVRPSSHEQPDKLRVQQDNFFKLFVGAIKDGQARGVFREGDASLLAQTAWANLHGAISLPINIDRVAFAAPKRLVGQSIAQTMEYLQRVD